MQEQYSPIKPISIFVTAAETAIFPLSQGLQGELWHESCLLKEEKTLSPNTPYTPPSLYVAIKPDNKPSFVKPYAYVFQVLAMKARGSHQQLLLVRQSAAFRKKFHALFARHFSIFSADNNKQAQDVLTQHPIDIVLYGPCKNLNTGSNLLRKLCQHKPQLVCLLTTTQKEKKEAILRLQEDGIQLLRMVPWRPRKLLSYMLDKARINAIIRSPTSPMQEICKKICTLAPYDIPVLLTGESGTGKELVARALHEQSHRWRHPFVVENCTAMPSSLLESELFGHKRGSFTGAISDYIGLFERANGGSIFLDEIGDISQELRVKLLRVLQENEIRPVGSSETRKIDVRVISATNRDIESEVQHGNFRKDLFFRLAGASIHLPPLQQRQEDIPILAKALLEQAMLELDKKVKGWAPEALKQLQQYRWPGNIRELKNEVRYALAIGKEHCLLGIRDLNPRILRLAATTNDPPMGAGSLREQVEALESRLIIDALKRHHWNKSKVARIMQLSRVGLRSKMARYSIPSSPYASDS